MTTEKRIIRTSDAGTELEGLFYSSGTGWPVVIVFPTFMGRGANEEAAAERLSGWGYDAFLADPYGGGRFAQDRDEASALMQPLIEDRSRLRGRVSAILETVKALPGARTDRIAAIGFCFGGLCALDLGRSGAELAGVASLHGLLSAPAETRAIRAKVAVFHGWDDPLAPPEQLLGLGQELSRAGADWQVLALGGTMHGFTNPKAAAPAAGIQYNPLAADRAWRALQGFLGECLS